MGPEIFDLQLLFEFFPEIKLEFQLLQLGTPSILIIIIILTGINTSSWGADFKFSGCKRNLTILMKIVTLNCSCCVELRELL